MLSNVRPILSSVVYSSTISSSFAAKLLSIASLNAYLYAFLYAASLSGSS
jgi:hypothetical protein